MRTFRVWFLILALAFTAGATTVQYVGHGPINDGSVWVGPYTLNVGGVDMPATCMSWNIEIAQTWAATEYEIGNVPYLEAEWLNLQFATHPTMTVAIHHGIWDIFGASYADGLPWVVLAAANYSSVSPDTFRVLVPNVAGASQTFLIPHGDGDVPEAGTLLLGGIGMALVGIVKWRRRV